LSIVPPNGFVLPAAIPSSRFLDATAVDPAIRRAHGNAPTAHCQKP
jgi:hypothetical protein